ncbi:hypothetical protein GOP47_0010236 [Adiantum capillus-veneris]|uniref:Uncharacterized protein n=1 Tax=Adiantum capillus-veneris TaxID=13818 RepID=A0A9D4ZIJ4_ADICA|nr:hypothetical protein GOP47_0010236 [Adiantum capillus-veneris]
MEDYEVDEMKQAAADVLFDYSLFAMTCIGEAVHPARLRMHLMKEVSGMPTSLKKDNYQAHSLQLMPTKGDKGTSSGLEEKYPFHA